MEITTRIKNWVARQLILSGFINVETIEWDNFLRKTSSGVHVTPNTALRNSAVLRAVILLSETIAQVPLGIFNKFTKKVYTDIPLARVLALSPNRYMSSFDLRTALMTNLLTRGNCFAEIERNGRGQVIGLYPLDTDKMSLMIDKKGEIWYKYSYFSGEMEKGEVIFKNHELLHVKWLHSDGLWGKSAIQLAREAVGLSLAAEDYGATFFGSGGKPDSVLTTDVKLKDTTIEKLKQQWAERRDKTLILEEGLKYQSISLPPEDSQFIETRKFQIAEIARLFGVPPHMLGDLERATFSNIEHQNINFVIYSAMPWMRRFEQEMERKLLSEKEQQEYSIRFRVDGLLRGDTESRYKAYSTGRHAGFLSTNDIREKEDLPSIEGGDEYNAPLNTIPTSLEIEYWQARINALQEKGGGDAEGGTDN